MTALKTFYVTVQASYLVEVLGYDADDAGREAMDVFQTSGSVESIEVTDIEEDRVVHAIRHEPA